MLDPLIRRRRCEALDAKPAERATSRLHRWVIAIAVVVPGCVDGDPVLSQTESAATVADYASSGCSTAVVLGLSQQIAQQADCTSPGSFVAFSATGGITFTSNAVLPYLEQSARDHLVQVAASAPLQINSALRSVAQQYLLYRWYQNGSCGISAAATPGRSNHEGGRAVDVANYSSRISAMANRGWAHDVPGDVVHFDHTASPDGRGQDVRAFQVLWNRNHPNDVIGEDGAYGPQTEARLRQAPSTGFAIGPTCNNQFARDLDVVSIQGPDIVPPETRVHYAIVIQNSGQADWPATTQLAIANGTSSPLHDTSWISATVVATLGDSVLAGGTTTIDFDVMTPKVDVDTPIAQVLELTDSGASFGTINLALTVAPGTQTPTSSDGNEVSFDSTGGCDAGGGSAGSFAPLLVLLAGFVRRRR
jgi:uncharacterized protein (TIGR03382 family)